MKHWVAPAVLAVLVCIAGCGGDDGGGTSLGPTVEAVFMASPAAGTVITDFVFDATASSTSGSGLEFRWDWENDGTWDTGWSSTATATHRYSSQTDGQVDTVEVALEAKSGSTTEADTVEVTIDARHGFVLSTFPLYLTQATAVAADSAELWVSDWGSPGSGRLYRYQAATGDTIYSIPSPDIWPSGLAWDGTNVCVAGHLQLRKLDPTNGDVVSSFPIIYSNGQWGGGLAWDGTIFYLSSIAHSGMGGDDLIHKYSATGTELGTLNVPVVGRKPRGLAFDGVHLWCTVSDEDTLFVLDPVTGAVQRAVYMDTQDGDIAVLNGFIWSICDVGPGSVAKVVP
jgi:hypothetical protein